MGTLMGLHEIDEISKIIIIYLSMKIINNTTSHPQRYLQGSSTNGEGKGKPTTTPKPTTIFPVYSILEYSVHTQRQWQ
jgi:hypothetical protein